MVRPNRAKVGARHRYATDGKCHNAEPGTFGRECYKPAVWIGTRPSGYRTGFCDDCRQNGYEAPAYGIWERVAAA